MKRDFNFYRATAISILVLAQLTFALKANACDSIDQCMKQLPTGIEYTSNPEVKTYTKSIIIPKLQSYGREALPQYFKLINSRDRYHRFIGWDLIKKVSDIEPQDAEIIKSAIAQSNQKSKNTRLLFDLLLKIDDDSHLEFIVNNATKNNFALNYRLDFFQDRKETTAKILLGILETQVSQTGGQAEKIVKNMRQLAKSSRLKVNAADQQIMTMILNDSLDIKLRLKLTGLLQNFPADTLAVDEQLYQLILMDERFLTQGRLVLSLRQSHYGAELYVDTLKVGLSEREYSINGNGFVYYALMLAGRKAGYLGHKILPLLDSPIWIEQQEVALALGAIGYAEAAPKLLKLISNNQNWKLAEASLIALNLFSEKSIAHNVVKASQIHWYQPIRQLGLEISELLKKRTVEEALSGNDYKLPLPKIKQFHWKCPTPANATSGIEQIISATSKAEGKLKRFKYQRLICESFSDGKIDVCRDIERELIPDYVFKFNSGWLSIDSVQFNEINYLNFMRHKKGQEATEAIERQYLEFVQDLFIIEGNIYVLTRKLAGEEGFIFKLNKDSNSSTAKRIYRLPAAPTESWIDENNVIHINTQFEPVTFDVKTGLQISDCKA